MIINGTSLFEAAPIKEMASGKIKAHGYSYGLSEVGYDIRLKQEVKFFPPQFPFFEKHEHFGYTEVEGKRTLGRTALASSIEEFQMPFSLWGELRNKSTLARQFVDATIGTDVEPGWSGFLTIEIIFHGLQPVILPAGCPIAKVVFHELTEESRYDGKYQNQANKPVEAILK